jgi:formin-binding protein 1
LLQYFDACSETDSSRLKLEKLPAGDRHADRYQSTYKKATTDMNTAKNDYILSIQVANEIKRRFYDVDMPGITSELRRFMIGGISWFPFYPN